MSRTLRLLAFAAAVGAAALLGKRAAAQDVPPILWPEYEITVSDGARLKKLFKENAWMKEFQASNLFRGSMVRLGPVLYAAGTNDSWKGRLVDFLAERFLDGRPVRLSYFHAPELVSPFGVTLPGLSPREHEALKLVVKVLRSGEDVTTKVTLEENRVEDVAVTPLALRLQRFAAVETPECLAISRDPRVAAVLSRRCAREPRLAAAVVDVDTHAFFSAWSVVLYRLFGVDDQLRLTFDWDQKRARFTPAGAELTLAKDHLLGTGPVDPALLGAIPADTLFFATVFVPDPGALSIASVETYFRTAREKRSARAVPVSLLYFGMTTGENDRPQALSALLLPQPKGDDRALSDLDALFNQSSSYKVLVSRACPGYVALSPSKAALQRIEEACAGRRPSFQKMSPKLLQAFTRQPVSSGAFWNAGAFLKSAVAWGWRRDTPDQEIKWKGEKVSGRHGDTPPPKELADAMQLLDRLPMYAFAGRATGDAVVMTGAEP